MEVTTVVRRVRAEFEEMPGMTLTMPQASRRRCIIPRAAYW